VVFGHDKENDEAVASLGTLSEDNYELLFSQLISLGSDGPNVNKTIWKYTDSHMKETGLHGHSMKCTCMLFTFENGVSLMRLGRQWSGIIHYY